MVSRAARGFSRGGPPRGSTRHELRRGGLRGRARRRGVSVARRGDLARASARASRRERLMALDLSGGVAENLSGGQILIWCDGPPGRVAGVELWKRAVFTACRAGFDRLVIVVPAAADDIRRALEGDHRLDGRRWEVAAPA